MADAVPMVEVWRGDIAESHHRGHAVICDASGAIRAAWGDPEAVILPRSSCKMLQALPLVESGAADGLGSEQLALACASHQGAAMHVERVARWLGDLGPRRGRPALRPAGARRRARAASAARGRRGALPAAQQLLGQARGLPHAGPAPRRRAGVRRARPPGAARASAPPSRRCAAPAASATGIDGCSAPNFATTMHGLARAMARMADPRGLGPTREAAVRRLVAAMLAHPLLVAGEGRACSELMAAMDGVAVKTGAEAVYVAILPAQGLGVALKIEDGATRASECAITALLVRLGAIAADNPAAARRLRPPLFSRRGFPAGAIRPDPAFWAGAAL